MNSFENLIFDSLLLDSENLSHSQLVEKAQKAAAFHNPNGLFEYDIEKIVNRYEMERGVITFDPIILAPIDNSGDWFVQKNLEGVPTHYFNRYRKTLQKDGFSFKTINQIKQNSIEILKKSANPDAPKNSPDSKRKGLVIGDVQSGKTANFLAVINLAVDYGYHFILVLSGITEYLRRQTQMRIDKGFIGAKSDTISDDVVYVGVGQLKTPHKYYAIPVTTTKVDFIKFIKSNTNWRQSDTTKPVVIVGKKNSSVLKQIGDWILSKDTNLHPRNILIIDDEADNASVNTKKTSEDPSTINRLIRKIYNNVNVATYIGFTATPFANIFIDPRIDARDPTNSDLFPSDFIIQLKSDSKYFGYEKLVNDQHIKILDVNEPGYLELGHECFDDSFEPTESLLEAIKTFLLTCVVRTLRGQPTAHRTMMINISIYNFVQSAIEEEISNYVWRLKITIEQTSHFPDEKFFREKEMKDLYDIYTNDPLFENARKNYSWNQIKEGLVFEITKFETRAFNFRSDKFNYDEHEDVGARLIAIGGYVLSRGLTLEGLNISYFNRRASYYDTMLQMCRWFGYRPNYEDLCRVYMTKTNADNYGAVMDAIDDLELQLREMKLQNKKPSDFGLMVKQSPETLETDLLISARNKLRGSEEIPIQLNYGGVVADTSKLFKDTKNNNLNVAAVEAFVNRLNDAGIFLTDVPVEAERSRTNRAMFLNVPQNYIADLIASIHVPIENKKFDTITLSEYISNSKNYPIWDVVFAQGNKRENALLYTICGKDLVTSFRASVDYRENEDFLRVGSSNNRLIDPGLFNSGLTKEQIEIAVENAKRRAEETGKSNELIAKDYLKIESRKPLLVIYPIQLEENFDNFYKTPLMGFGIGFPAKESSELVRYRANIQKMKEYYEQRGYNYYDHYEEENDDD